MAPCTFCRSDDDVRVTAHIALCDGCAAQLGRMLTAHPLRFRGMWPALDEDDDDPEPRVRLDDGTSVELRERTAALKQDLTVEQRADLAGTLAALDLQRESVLECAFVLAAEPTPELGARMLALLFPHPLAAPQVSELRTALYPC